VACKNGHFLFYSPCFSSGLLQWHLLPAFDTASLFERLFLLALCIFVQRKARRVMPLCHAEGCGN
jgi:hypothetical protein